MNLTYSKYVVHGVRVDKNKNCTKVTKGQRPHFYSIYGIDSCGHEICILDSRKKVNADAMANEWNALIAEAQGKNCYARIQWLPEDVKTLRPRWSLARCEEELGAIERHLESRTIELGYEVLGDLLPSK